MRYSLISIISIFLFYECFTILYRLFGCQFDNLVVCIIYCFQIAMGMCSASKSDLENVSKPNKIRTNKISSAVLSNQKDSELFFKQIISTISKSSNKKPINYEMLYRASANNFSAQKFHNATDGISNTILLVRSANNYIFGAYTPCKWTKDILYKYETDPSGHSFLFCLQKQDGEGTKQVKSEMKPGKVGQFQLFKIKDNQKAIMSHSDSGPIFGEGHDIFIADKCNKNESWSNLGRTYDCRYPFGSQKANRALAQQDKFLISQYEVWAIQLK